MIGALVYGKQPRGAAHLIASIGHGNRVFHRQLLASERRENDVKRGGRAEGLEPRSPSGCFLRRASLEVIDDSKCDYGFLTQFTHIV